MSIIGLLPLLLATGSGVPPLDMAGWQACRREPSPLVRLACYDALGNEETPPGSKESSKSPAWLAIEEQELARVPESSPFLLRQDEENGTAILTRPALRGATLAIGCVNSITHIRLRLDAPWRGDTVQVARDGVVIPDSQSWFIRDKGWLLEYGRGLPAIEELKRWIGHRELQVQAADGSVLRVDLSGLKAALQPVRQQCRW